VDRHIVLFVLNLFYRSRPVWKLFLYLLSRKSVVDIESVTNGTQGLLQRAKERIRSCHPFSFLCCFRPLLVVYLFQNLELPLQLLAFVADFNEAAALRGMVVGVDCFGTVVGGTRFVFLSHND
jgi:hypothetical protein